MTSIQILFFIIGLVLICTSSTTPLDNDSIFKNIKSHVKAHTDNQVLTKIGSELSTKLQSFVSAEKPGVRFMLENSGVNMIIQDALPEIIENIKSTPFPDQSITTSVALAGEITVNLTNIRMTNLVIDSVTAAFQEPNHLTATANGVSVFINLDFSFKQKSWPHTGGSGDIVANCTDSTISLTVATGLRTDQPGKPSFQSTNSQVSLGTMKIKINGGGSVGWLLNVLEGLFKNQIKKSLEANMQESMKTTIDVQLNDVISETPFVFPIPFPPELDIQGEVDFSLPTAPRVSGGSAPALVVDSLVKFGIPGRPAKAPFDPSDLPTDASSKSNDFSLYVTQWIPNNAIWQLFNDGKLNYRLTNDIIPPESPIHLNTTDLRNYIPELYAKYPNRLVIVDVSALSSPSVTFSVPIVSVLNVSLTFSIVDTNMEIVPAFRMKCNIGGGVNKFSVVASDDGTAIKIAGVIDDVKIEAALDESWMGPVNVDRIRTTVSILINNGILPTINEKLAEGQSIPLPEGVKVSNIVFEFINGYLSIGGQVKYKPGCGSSLYWFKRRVFMTRIERLVYEKYGCIAGYYERSLCRDMICKNRL